MARSYLRTVMTVITGAAAAQAIPLLVMPLLTRLVSPQEMGVYSAWFAIATMASIAASGRLDVVTITSGPAGDKRSGMLLGSMLATGVALVIAGIGFAAEAQVARAIGHWSASATVSLALAVWAIAMASMWRAYAVSQADFASLNRQRIVGAGGVALLQVAAVWVLSGDLAMMWGYATGMALGVAYAHARLSARLHAGAPRPSFAQLLAWGRSNARISLYALPADLINNVARQLPVLLVAARFGLAPAGLLALALRTLDAPIMVISMSVQDAFKQRAADEYARHGNCRTAFLETLKLLTIVAIAPCLAVAAAGPWLFELVYGSAWREAGVIAVALVPLMFIRFSASPLGYVLYIANRPGQQLAWQTGLLVSTVVVFVAASDFMSAVIGYSIAYSLMYVLYLSIGWRAARGSVRLQKA